MASNTLSLQTERSTLVLLAFMPKPLLDLMTLFTLHHALVAVE
jgi:hypothetical protein